jgi:hypothetical protein
MRSKWFWMARVMSKLSIAEVSIFEVALGTQNHFGAISQRIWLLNYYINYCMKARPEFTNDYKSNTVR